MPGLLQSPDADLGWVKFGLALGAEFLGVFLFAFAGSAVPAGSEGSGNENTGNFTANWAPWGNGITLAVLVYITANISGGHLNPAVTLATMISGHIDFLRGVAYMVVQIAGGIFGSLLVAGLVPGSYIGMGNSGTGCFSGGPGVNDGMILGWEFFMTFILISTVYAVAIGEPSFPETGPLAVGLALFAMVKAAQYCFELASAQLAGIASQLLLGLLSSKMSLQVFVGSQYTGTAINPARVLAPASVFHCNWNIVWLYLIGEFLAGVVVGLTAGPLYGTGAPWVRKVVPWFPKEDGAGRGSLQKGQDKHDEMERQHSLREHPGNASAANGNGARQDAPPAQYARYADPSHEAPQTEMTQQTRPWVPDRHRGGNRTRANASGGAQPSVAASSQGHQPQPSPGDNREAISPDLLDSRIMDSRILDSHSRLMHKPEPSHMNSGPAAPAQVGISMT